MNRLLLTALLFISSNLFFGQSLDYSTLLIPDSLKVSANSVIRNQSITIDIQSQKSMVVKTLKVITVLNVNGISNIDAREYYGASDKITTIQATIYNSIGKEIKKIRRSDFKDQSVADGFSVLTDDRYYLLEYTPTEYPFTVVYESEFKTSTTAFIPSWNPIDDYYESVQKSEITLHYPADLGFKYKEYNFEGNKISKNEQANSIHFFVENIVAQKPEEFSPAFTKIFPNVKFALEKFYLEGKEGTAKTWEDFGIWNYNALLKDTEELPIETQTKIQQLVGTETDPLKKARIIYQYVQDKTRYVSIQLGIGGWKPMMAKEVDRLGYGDCKALSNYTRVLLKTVGVEAYYTEIYGSSNMKDFQKDFVSMQGNHIILTIPNQDKWVFLECTSQTLPFGFQGDFTDDRYALLIKPTGGEIIKTNSYAEQLSSQVSNGKYTLDSDGTVFGSIQIKSKGIQYDDRYTLERASKDAIDQHYKKYFYWINNLKLEKSNLSNDKESVEFTENLQLSATGFANTSGTSMLFPINLFNQNTDVPQRYRNRKFPFEIPRGYLDEDQVEVILPEGYKLDAKPNNIEIKDQFGTYVLEIKEISPSKLMYKRSLLVHKGFYSKNQYDNYRKFREQIAKADSSKIVLIKS